MLVFVRKTKFMSMTRPLPPIEYKEKGASISHGVWSAQHRRLTLGLILITLGPAFEGLAVATILPKIVANLGGLSLYGWSFSIYMLAMLVGIILAGDEADRRGPALPFIFGMVLFVLGLILAGTASSMLTLVVSRGVQGFGAGIITSVAYVCVGRGYPEKVKPRMLAVLSSAWIVPGLIGPALAGVVADFVGWRWVFLGLVPILPLATGLVLPALRKLAPSMTSGSLNLHRLLATFGLVIGAGMILTGLQMQSILMAALLVLPGLTVGISSLRYVLPPGTLRAKAGMPAAIATIGFLSLAYFGGEAFLPLTLISLRGQSTILAGVALTAATLSWTAGSWLQAHLAPRQGRRLLVTAGLLLGCSWSRWHRQCAHSRDPSSGSNTCVGSCRAWHGAGLFHAQPRRPGNGTCRPGRFGFCIDGDLFRTRISTWYRFRRGDCRICSDNGEFTEFGDRRGRYPRYCCNWPCHSDRGQIAWPIKTSFFINY